MFEVCVEGWFSAAHRLRLAGVLEPLHGHNWRIRVTFAGESLDASGLLLDFTKLHRELDAVLRGLHDRNLNELPALAECNPSAENVALLIGRELAGLARDGVRLRCVEVEEAPGCTARWLP
jgi:6-pyruvoyltetrahydropterin/6-carboxytetrahydropterin synthase